MPLDSGRFPRKHAKYTVVLEKCFDHLALFVSVFVIPTIISAGMWFPHYLSVTIHTCINCSSLHVHL